MDFDEALAVVEDLQWMSMKLSLHHPRFATAKQYQRK